VLKHWCKRDRDIVAEIDIAISKEEASSPGSRKLFHFYRFLGLLIFE
jgi:hypothetical protein